MSLRPTGCEVDLIDIDSISSCGFCYIDVTKQLTVLKFCVISYHLRAWNILACAIRLSSLPCEPSFHQIPSPLSEEAGKANKI